MRRRAPFVARTLAVICRVALGTAARVKTEGLDALPQDGPLIVIANHISNADPPLVYGWLTPALGRQMHILAKEALFVGPVGWFLRNIGVTRVKSGGSDIEAYRAAKAVLDRGQVLCIFPEGTRSLTGIMQEPKPGVAMLATRSHVNVIAVGISGSDQFLGRGKRMPRLRSTITIRAGAPFTLTLDATLPRRAAMVAASDELMGHIADLVDVRHRGRFDSETGAPEA